MSPRYEHLFISFIRELQAHFREHHDIRFYASRLNILPVYLSRIVRAVTGRTVIDFINQLLTMEASRLLRSTDLSATQIADRLHFADQSSFSKFFTRSKGVTPRDFRAEGR
ncbi:MAG: AraC family transcriptional regulator [Bacteroidaceae bacterium]|nr:AraC family transcriptional regulator [Bacteroidaceae bacterium]